MSLFANPTVTACFLTVDVFFRSGGHYFITSPSKFLESCAMACYINYLRVEKSWNFARFSNPLTDIFRLHMFHVLGGGIMQNTSKYFFKVLLFFLNLLEVQLNYCKAENHI